MIRMRNLLDTSLQIWSPAPGNGGHGPDDRRGPCSCAVAGISLFVDHCISQRAAIPGDPQAARISSKVLVE